WAAQQSECGVLFPGEPEIVCYNKKKYRNKTNHSCDGRNASMPRIHRRKLLKLSGAGAVAATTGGMAGILATSRAPAYAQAATVHWLRWNDFVPTSDKVLREQIIP